MKFLWIFALFAASFANELTISDFKVAILEKEQASNSLKALPVFSKSPQVLKGEPAQRLFISFGVKNKANGENVEPQQVFIRFDHVESGEDAVIVLPKVDGVFKYDNVLRVAAKHFHNLSGKFKASVLVGGVGFKNAIEWYFADFDLALPVVYTSTPKSQQIRYEPLPTIEHQFRQPEKRPAAIISDVFTLICLSPLVLLVGAWLKIGINFGNAPASLWVPIFHVGLAAIFGLYFLFWLQFNMFETLKYLSILGFFTFVAGNCVLRALADQRKSKTQ